MALSIDDIDTPEELLATLNDLMEQNAKLQKTIINNQVNFREVVYKSLNGLRQLVCLGAICASGLYAVNLLSPETKEQLSEHYLQALIAVVLGTGGISQLVNQSENKPNNPRHSRLDQEGSLESERQTGR